MAFHIEKPSAMNPDVKVYYVKKSHWCDNYDQRKTWASNTSPTSLMRNTDGKNGGWEGASIVEE